MTERAKTAVTDKRTKEQMEIGTIRKGTNGDRDDKEGNKWR